MWIYFLMALILITWIALMIDYVLGKQADRALHYTREYQYLDAQTREKIEGAKDVF